MRSPLRLMSGAIVAAVLVYSCADSSHTNPVAPTGQPIPLIPDNRTPEYTLIPATDSLMRVTTIAYSDTALALRRLNPLSADVSATATIGKNGGSIRIDKAGVRIDIPSGALSQSTTITVTARAGSAVAYEFLPHGITFAQPVKVTQDVKQTAAALFPILLKNAHGGYYDGTLDNAWMDPGNNFLRVKEHQLGYLDVNGSNLRFYIGHFSGYIVICGRDEVTQ